MVCARELTMSEMRSSSVTTTPLEYSVREAAVWSLVQCIDVRHRVVALRLSNLRASRRGYTCSLSSSLLRRKVCVCCLAIFSVQAALISCVRVKSSYVRRRIEGLDRLLIVWRY